MSESATNETAAEKELAHLRTKAQVTERPFASDLPLVGRLVAGVRAAWNSVAAKWYVRPMLAQQNEFNSLVITHLERLHAQLADQEARLSAADRTHVAAVRETAELTAQLVQLNRVLADLDERLARLEPGEREADAG